MIDWVGRQGEIAKFIIRQPPIWEQDDYAGGLTFGPKLGAIDKG